jgi:eukaryotic-like serine/threonine-protein kinase
MPSDPRFEQLSDLFETALSLPDSERSAWLAEACSDDPELRREAEQMLAAHAGRGLLDRALPDPPPADIEARLRAALADGYLVERELGRGGMAMVYLARERKHGRAVVIKVLKPDVAAWCGPERFLREVHIAARLAHPHILGLIDSGSADGLLYYVMPYLGGETLRTRLDRLGALPVPEAVALLRDVADALTGAHGAGVVHRDLKPENILCVGDRAWLMDFGVAKLLIPLSGHALVSAHGAVLGTPAYMAPEQVAAAADLDGRADIYAWGLIAHEMLAGRRAGGDASERPSAMGPGVPAALAGLVADCVVADPRGRVQSAERLLSRIGAVDPGVGTGDASVRSLRRPR